MKTLTWQERARQVAIFHYGQVKDNAKWRIEDTAKQLNRSNGRISEDLLLASWMKTHPKVETFEKVQDALAWVKKKKLELKLANFEGV